MVSAAWVEGTFMKAWGQFPLYKTLYADDLIKCTQLLGPLCLWQCLLLPSLWCQLKLRPKVTNWKSSYCCWFVRSLRACEVLMFSTVSPWLPSLDSQRTCRLLSITLRWTSYSLIILTILAIIITIIIFNIIIGHADHCPSHWGRRLCPWSTSLLSLLSFWSSSPHPHHHHDPNRQHHNQDPNRHHHNHASYELSETDVSTWTGMPLRNIWGGRSGEKIYNNI